MDPNSQQPQYNQAPQQPLQPIPPAPQANSVYPNPTGPFPQQPYAPQPRQKGLFVGRMGRMQYFIAGLYLLVPMVALLVIYFIIIFVEGVANLETSALSTIVNVIFFLAFAAYIVVSIVVSYGLMVRRIHDFNVTGWLALLSLIGNGIFSLVVLFVPGTQGQNTYGERPSDSLKFKDLFNR